MKKINLNIIIYLLIGIAIGLSIAVVTVKVYKNNNETVTTNNKEKTIEEETIETEPVEYFTGISQSTDKGTLKQGFIKIVDFLFYDEPINGIKFSELKDEAKLKIMKIALSIDSKIDYYFPGYKETLSNGTKKLYSDVKLKVAELYIKVTTKICSNNQQLCIDAKEGFNSMKDSFGLTFDFLKNIGKDELNKLKEWYEDFRN